MQRSARTLMLATGVALSVAEARAAEPAPPPIELGVELRPTGTDTPWILHLSNRGDRPVALVADPRLLELEVRVPGRKGTVTCRLPAPLAPERAEPRRVVALAAGETVEAALDPRLYCFASAGQDVLVPGAYVVPRFGWPEEKRTAWRRGKRVAVPERAPFVAGPAPEAPGGKRRKVGAPAAGAKRLVGEGFALGSEYATWAATAIRTEATPEGEILRLQAEAGSDASSERGVTVTVAVRNVSGVAKRVYVRRELLGFEIVGPRGVTTCAPAPTEFAPPRDAFVSLEPGRSLELTSRLRELCPAGTFDAAGLYLVHARLAFPFSGAEHGLEAFVGRLATERPVPVRVREGSRRVPPPRMRRVRLEPAP
ncbi:MAG: hypothetical protein IT376_08085 [Polyangiaceae bacterium]|nr:hypothetical protein [Polyangiaceae bacterium]